MNSGSPKRFALAVLKIACGTSLAVLILGLGIWGVLKFQEKLAEAANASLANLKVWRVVTAESLGNAQFRLQTIWRSGNVYYQFDMQGYPSVVAQAMERENQAEFTISFLDKDGFKLFEHRLRLTEMSRRLGGSGQSFGMSWKGEEFVSADLYRRAHDWELGWSNF